MSRRRSTNERRPKRENVIKSGIKLTKRVRGYNDRRTERVNV